MSIEDPLQGDTWLDWFYFGSVGILVPCAISVLQAPLRILKVCAFVRCDARATLLYVNLLCFFLSLVLGPPTAPSGFHTNHLLGPHEVRSAFSP